MRNKFIVIFITVGLLPLIFMGFLGIYLVNLTQRQSVSNLELQLISQKMEEIEKNIDEIRGLFQLQVAYEQYSEPDPKDQKFILEMMLEENKSLVELSFINTIEKEKIADCFGGEKPGLLGEETCKVSRYQKIFSSDLLNQKNLPKFLEAREGRDYFGEVYYTLEGPMVTIASSVYNKKGQIISVLSGEINLVPLQKIISRSRLGDEGYLLLLDRKGNLFAKSETIISKFENLKNMELASSVLAGGLRTGLEKKDLYQSFWGKTAIGAGKPIKDLGWAMISEWPERDAMEIVYTVSQKILQFSLVTLLIIISLAIIISWQIVKPIKILKEGAKIIGAGNFEHKIKIKTGDEVEELGEAFNKMAGGLKRLEELRNEFVFIAAHELRAPVAVIRGYLSMIMEGDVGPVPQKIKEFLFPVSKSSDSLTKLVQDLLEVARSEAGRIEIEVKPTDITEQVKSVLQELKILADEKSIKMIYEPSPGLPKILADSNKLKEVIKNLVDNAIKYTVKPGTITVYHEIKGKELLTHVKDTGIGISKESQNKLFQKFFRIKKEETREVQGTGLGLWIIKQLIEKMNGRIRVESEEGKGSTFSFSLPIA